MSSTETKVHNEAAHVGPEQPTSKEPAPVASSETLPPATKGDKKPHHKKHSGKGGDNTNKKKPAGGGAKKAPKIKEEVFLVVSMAMSGRTPLNGSIMSLGCVAVTANRQIVGTFSENMTLLKEAEGLQDVIGFWQAKHAELEVVCRGARPPSVVFPEFIEFCKPFGKCTLVGSPIMSMYSFLIHYFNKFCPGVSSMPWGFSGVCARSFASGVLGVPMKDFSKCEAFLAACEGLDTNGVPVNDALVAATFYTNLLRVSLKQDPLPITWSCDKPAHIGIIPPPLADAEKSMKAPLPFCEYPSITDPDFDTEFAGPNPQVCAEKEEAEWVVTEKVHGTNFSLITDGTHIRAAKRTGLLCSEESKCFFHFEYLQARLEQAVLQVFEYVKANVNDKATVVTTFGELAGGEFHHSQVPRSLLGRRVQQGVQYHPDNFFYGFDIGYSTEPLPSSTESADAQRSWHFLTFDEQQAAFKAAGLMAAKPLFRGPAAEALKYPCELQSTIPSALGLPELEVPNFAEGIVVRPVADIWVKPKPEDDEGEMGDRMDTAGSTVSKTSHGSRRHHQSRHGGHGPRRVMMKFKHPMFREFVVRPTKDMALDEIAIHLINANRVDAVLSKHTAEERQDVANMAALVAKDAMKDASGAFTGSTTEYFADAAVKAGTSADGEKEKLLQVLAQLAVPLVNDAATHTHKK